MRHAGAAIVAASANRAKPSARITSTWSAAIARFE